MCARVRELGLSLGLMPIDEITKRGLALDRVSRCCCEQGERERERRDRTTAAG